MSEANIKPKKERVAVYIDGFILKKPEEWY
jgi:hypothetical protein